MEKIVKRSWRRRAALTAAIATVAAATTMGAASVSAASEQGTAPATGQEIVEALTGLLPEGTEITESFGEGYQDSEYPYAYVEATDNTGGATTIDVGVHRSTGDWREYAGCPEDIDEGDAEDGFLGDCVETELSDGRLLSVNTWEYETDGTGEGEDGEAYHAIGWDVWLEGPGSPDFANESGRSVYLSQYKDLTEVADAGAYVPVLDEAQLAEAAQSQVWQDLLAALDAEYGEPVEEEWEGPDGPQIPAAQLQDTFRSLAPEGIEVTPVEAGEEEVDYASLLVDDGRGAVLVDIFAFGPWDEEGFDEGIDFDAAADEEFGPQCEHTILDNGDELNVCAWAPSDDDPLGLWSATVYYADGSSLDITQYNVADCDSDPTRADAPLSVDQLADIATDSAWQDLFGASAV
ncbi:hypothetical protein [Streptomyces xiamenensis]|uniref:hypothetical protein n=1 Tax=Streptomyces xiamenensis TaxID=408015 RepID=UPI0035D8D9D9